MIGKCLLRLENRETRHLLQFTSAFSHQHDICSQQKHKSEMKKKELCKIQLSLSSGAHKEGSGQHQRAASAAARSLDEPLTADNLHYFTHRHTHIHSSTPAWQQKKSNEEKKSIHSKNICLNKSHIEPWGLICLGKKIGFQCSGLTCWQCIFSCSRWLVGIKWTTYQ